MKKLTTKLSIALLIGLAILLFFHFQLDQYLTLAFLKSKYNHLLQYYTANPLTSITYYMAIYIITTALSLPGATILTLAGGAILGLWKGVIVISFASTIGATLAFIASRYLFRDFVQTKFEHKLKTINEGIKKEGAFYLFTLRLIPIFPFFLINLLLGLTPMGIVTFFLVSQVGMFAGTVVYVNAGTQLAKITSLQGLLSMELILAFSLIGIFPLLAKRLIEFLKTRRIYAKYPKPSSFDYNIIVIGAGSGGLVSAYIASAVKSKVALIEKHQMGGDCLNTGCVPSKALIRSSKIVNYIKRATDFGFNSASVDFDFDKVMERVQNIIQKVAPHDSIERYTKLGVDCFTGHAKILSPFRVQINNQILTTRNIVIATGATPFVPTLPGIDEIKYLTSDTIWQIRKLPSRLLVLGGGPIGCELAQCFTRLGSEVTIVQRGQRILNKEDEETSQVVMEQFRKEGIKLLYDHQAIAFEKDGDSYSLICESKKGEQKIHVPFDQVLVALGRKATVTGFGLEDLQVPLTNRGTITADEFLRTNYPNIYVVGDVVGPYQFTHTAAHQAWYASINALFSPLKSFKADYRVIPRCTFTDPEVAHVGLNEQEAKEQNIPYEVTTYGIDDLDRAMADSEDHGFIKVLTVPGKDKILGATIVGTHAGDIIIEYIAAMKHGFGMNKILETIHIYPTLVESNKFAAGNWKKNHAPKKALEYLARFHAWRRKEKR